TLTYQQHENAFTQPNGKVAEQMLGWALEKTEDAGGDLLELYCGNGNFSIALAQNFRQVLATELSKQSVSAAQWNIRENGVKNLKVARLSAEELTEALEGKRKFRRLEQQDIDLAEYNFSTVLVDPPRAGIDEAALAKLQSYPNILYISCNPETLKANLRTLHKTHRVSHTALFDQFPYTHHREMGVFLERR
ncbi:MAG: methyltransferase domain-containing protein, partial [Verrucomicrobiota bacterium]